MVIRLIRFFRKIPQFVKYRIDFFRFQKLQLSDVYQRDFPNFSALFEPSSPNLQSEIVSERRFLEPEFFYWMYLLKENPKLHSKQFQFYAIMDRAFSIKKGSGSQSITAIGFGVGKEPIPSALVSLGYKVVATDYFEGNIAKEWRSTGQQLEKLLDLNQRKIVSNETFLDCCTLLNIDMNSIPSSLHESFDFVWSSCALGHIGSYKKGLDFVLNSLKLLKPGGWAVHTTEIDKSNSTERFESPNLNFYKLSDLEEALDNAERLGFTPLRIKEKSWDGISEKYIMSEPWEDKPHIRIEIFGREINSVVIQIQRPY
jgi:hypothetical protein